MSNSFAKLSDTDLRALTSALKSRRISAPYPEVQVSRVLAPGVASPVATGLAGLSARGFSSEQIVAVLELLDHDRCGRKSAETQIDLVTSGPEAPGITNRDTSVVVRELFAHARKSVLVVGYAVYQGRHVFEELAKRMEKLPELQARLFLNIARPDGDNTPPEILVSRFAQRFRDCQWPAHCRLPEVYYDPRSVADDTPVRSSLHAKCVVVDAEHVFVSSANFTEAGQERNVEVGLQIHSPWTAGRLIRHFQLLYDHGLAARAF